MNGNVRFTWDSEKAEGNIRKHGVRFEVATAVLLDPDRIDFDATRPEFGESRRAVIGSVQGVVLTVIYTLRGEVVRIISARRAHRTERARYERR